MRPIAREPGSGFEFGLGRLHGLERFFTVNQQGADLQEGVGGFRVFLAQIGVERAGGALKPPHGGGVAGNLERILPAGLVAELDPTNWPEPPIFRLIAERGAVARAEMYRVFNMGLGMAVVVAPSDVDTTIAESPELRPIGQVREEIGAAGSSVSGRAVIMGIDEADQRSGRS